MTRYLRQTRNVLAVAIFLFTIMFIKHSLPSDHHFADDMHRSLHRKMIPYNERDDCQSDKHFVGPGVTGEADATSIRIPPPWDSSLEGRQEWNYIDGEFEWDVVTPKYSYGGEEVAYKNKVSQANLVNRIFRRAIDYVDRRGNGCKKGSVSQAWRVARQWDKSDFIVLVECPTSMNRAAPDAIQSRSDFPQHHMVHVPFRAGVIHSPNSFKVPETPLAIIVPIACKVQTFETFLRRTVDELEKVSGSKRIVIAWGECEENPKGNANAGPLLAANSFEQLQNIVRAEVARHRNKIPVEIVRTNIPFSRSSTLNAGIAGISDQEIAVVLDIDMTAEHPYFVHARAFTSHGGAYFPIVFSFFNPVYSKRKSHIPINVHPKLGRWRGKGYGMLAAKKIILDRVDGYNTNHSVWGLEDRELFERVKSMSGSAGASSEPLAFDGSAGDSNDSMDFEQDEEASLPSSASKSSRIQVWRVHDPHLAHEWHDKQCGHLKGTNRYLKCMGSKATAEGSQIQLALKILSKRRADGDSRK